MHSFVQGEQSSELVHIGLKYHSRDLMVLELVHFPAEMGKASYSDNYFMAAIG